jgi:predicted enzyme related to lactoylglutathione lyase
MRRRFDHVTEVAAFYQTILPALGFSSRVAVEGWLQFEAADGVVTEFFGITESSAHIRNENRVAFWAQSAADVDRLAEVAARAGARNMEGPMDYEPGYYAVFFEDPCGNRLEVCHHEKEVVKYLSEWVGLICHLLSVFPSHRVTV